MINQKLEFQIPVRLHLVDSFPEDPDVIARVFYPGEGNKIQILKGLNRLEFEGALLHELGHLFDWYLGKQSSKEEVRELSAESIAGSLKNYLNKRPK